jgi:peptidoglycan/xylan/chitin deacetylase (PgdA/CDA1 family)
MVRGFPWARVSFFASLAIVWWSAPAALLVAFASLVAGVFWNGAGLFARPILAGRGDGKIALTFDDGPDPVETRKVMDALEAGGHRGTFFVIGARAEAHPDLLTELARRGHLVANHSYHHAYTTAFAPPARLAEELESAQALIARATGKAPRWFRPPVGILSPRVVEAARRSRLELVGWSANARDGVATTVEEAAARLTRALRPGAILVLHDCIERGGRAPIAADVVERLSVEMERRGLKSVTLDELLDPPG